MFGYQFASTGVVFQHAREPQSRSVEAEIYRGSFRALHKGPEIL